MELKANQVSWRLLGGSDVPWSSSFVPSGFRSRRPAVDRKVCQLSESLSARGKHDATSKIATKPGRRWP